MASKQVVLLTAASGSIGKATLQALATYSNAFEVRAGVRNPLKAEAASLSSLAPNVSVVAADPINSAEINEALKGVDSVFIIAPGHIDRSKISIAAIEAAKSAGVKFILVLSVFTADLPDTVFGGQFGPIEESAKASGLPFTIIRLPFFVDNTFGFASTISSQGAFYSSAEGDKPFSAVLTADVGKVAAKILSDPSPHIGKTYKLSSPAYSHNHLAKTFAKALEKDVNYVQVPYEAAKEALTGLGFQPWQADGINELQKLINSDSPVTNDADGPTHVASILGHPPVSIEEWVAENIAAFK